MQENPVTNSNPVVGSSDARPLLHVYGDQLGWIHWIGGQHDLQNRPQESQKTWQHMGIS